MRRLLWFLAGLALGVGLALLVGWVLFPRDVRTAGPASLRSDYQDEYVRLIALAYQLDGDLSLARERLAALDEAEPSLVLVRLTELWISQEKSATRIKPLVFLARDLSVDTPMMAPYLQ